MLATAAVLAVAAAPAGAATRVRVFAVQPKLDVSWMQSRDSYRAKMFALADRSLRGPGPAAVQDGADDFASHLSGRDLVVWPEDIGLFAALTGQRAAPARASGSLEGAIASLIAAYAPQNAYYAQRFPAAAQRSLPVRLTLLSLTDTFGRVAVETFSEMAERYHVWLEAGVNMAQDWRVVCDDMAAFNASARLPGGVRCSEQSPLKVRQLGDPSDPGRDYAYEATSDRVSNMALLFGPDGRLVSKQVKTYLTPIELPGQLDLTPGAVTGGLSAVRTPVGTLGFVTSKDAWMPDVQAKLDAEHVDLLVQPEFFVNDLVSAKGMWSPDTLEASAYGNVLRMPSVAAVVLPELTGNVFDFSADAQSHFALKPGRARAPAGHLVGQPDAPGLVASPWVVPDPARRGEPYAARRAPLARAGAALAPGSGVRCADPSKPAACENGHVEGVFWRDVRVNARPRYRRFRGHVGRTDFTRARPLAAAPRAQRNVSVSLHGRFGAAAFEERLGGRDAVLVATTRDGGRTWSHVRRAAPGPDDQRLPAVAAGGGRSVTLAWVDQGPAGPRVRVAFSRGGHRFTRARGLDSAVAAQWAPALAAAPGKGVAQLVWVDERERSADDDLPQAHVRIATVRRGAAGPSRRLDDDTPVALAAKLDNAWAPRVAVRGRRVLVAWTGFENYDWGVFARSSANGGADFGPVARVTDNAEGGAQQEELADSPDPLLAAGGPLIAWTDWRKRDSSATRPHQQYDVFVASPGGPNRHADPYGTRPVSTFAPSICATGGRDALVAFQDASAGRSTIRAVALRSGRRRGRALAVSDGGARAGNAWRPRLACSGGRVLALWEDQRDGPGQIYYAALRPGRAR